MHLLVLFCTSEVEKHAFYRLAMFSEQIFKRYLTLWCSRFFQLTFTFGTSHHFSLSQNSPSVVLAMTSEVTGNSTVPGVRETYLFIPSSLETMRHPSTYLVDSSRGNAWAHFSSEEHRATNCKLVSTLTSTYQNPSTFWKLKFSTSFVSLKGWVSMFLWNCITFYGSSSIEICIEPWGWGMRVSGYMNVSFFINHQK